MILTLQINITAIINLLQRENEITENDRTLLIPKIIRLYIDVVIRI